MFIWRCGRALIVPLALIGLLSLTSANSGQEKKTEEVKEKSPYPPRAFRRFGTDFLRHGSRIQVLAFDPSKNHLLAGGGNDPLRVWNLDDNGSLFGSSPIPWVQALAWHPKENRHVSTTAFRGLHLWDPARVEEGKIDNLVTALRAIAYSPEGKPIFGAGQDGQLLLIYPATRKVVPIPAHKGEVNAVAVSARKLYASGGSDRVIMIWKMASDSLVKLHDLKVPGMIHALAFTPDGKTLLSAGDDRVIRLWDVATWKNTHTLTGHKDTITAFALSLDGKTLVSSSTDDALGVWNLDKNELVRSIPRRFGDGDALALSPNGKLIAIAGINNTIRLFETDTGKERLGTSGPQAGLARLLLDPKSNVLTTLSAAGDLQQWHAADGHPVRQWPAKATPRVQQDFHLLRTPDGAGLITGSSSEPLLDLWDPANGKTLGTVPLPVGESLVATAVSPSGASLALGFRSGLVQVLEWPSRRVRSTAKAPGPIQALAFAVDTPVLAGAAAGKVHLWDVPTGQTILKIPCKDDAPDNSQPMVADLVFSPDGKTLAISGYDAVIRLVDWTTGKHLVACEGHTSAAGTVVFAPDGRTFASGSFDKTIRLWEAFVGQTIVTFKGHEGPITALTFAPDGRTLYSASSDTTALAWDVTGMSPAGKLPEAAAHDENDWKHLASLDIPWGNQAQWRLVAASKSSVDFLAKQIYLVDPKKVDQLFRDLGSEKFGVREKATQELEKYGRWMEGRLETSLEDPPTLEVRRRLERMLGILRGTGAITLKQERLRMYRALSILEQAGNAEAIKALEDLAQGAPEPEMQREADLSLKRARKKLQ